MDAENLVGLLMEVEDDLAVPRVSDVASHQEKAHDRMAPVLDAFASLLVSQEIGQVIATGVQQDKANGTLTLILASNDNNNGIIPEGTEKHAKRMFAALQDIGREYNEFRLKLVGTPRKKVKEADLPNTLKAKIQAFRTFVHRFSLAKFRQRLRKPHNGEPRVGAFIELFANLDASDESPVICNLRSISRILINVADMLEFYVNKTIPEESFKDYIEAMKKINLRTNDIFSDEFWEGKVRERVKEAASMLSPLLLVDSL